MDYSRFAYIGKYYTCICMFMLLSVSVSGQLVEEDTTAVPGIQTAPASPAKKSTVKDAVEFQSNDSLVVDFRNGRKAFLYGSAKVSHSAGELTAGEIEMDIAKTTIEATAASEEDTLSYPVLKRESDEIRSNRILFNYTTQKGKFETARIQVPDGYLIGSKIKNVSQDEVFIEDGIYSTCPPDYLYYYIKAKKMKVVNEEEIFFTNARLFILDIPYPLVFPFGYVPADFEKRRSGLLTPTYAFQAQSTRGIGLQNLGWFQYFNDYITGTFSSDVFTSGTFFTTTNIQYRKTGLFNGSVQIGYSRERGLEKTDPGFTTTVQRSLGLNHSQEFSPYSSISANINLRTADYLTRNSYDINERAQTNSNSKLSYKYRHPENLFNFSINSQLAQNFTNNTTSLSGPSSSFSLKALTPFKASAGSNPKWYESISIRYNNNFNSSFDFNPIDDDSTEIGFIDALFDPDQYREATGNNDYIQYGFRQTAAIQISQLLSIPFINVSGNISANEYWFPSTTRRTFNADSNRVESSKELGFTAARDFSTGLNMSTTFYGISNAKIGRMEGFRHTVQPVIGFSYRPDFSDPKFGYYRTVQSDTNGNTQVYSIFEDQVFSGPGRGESRSLTFRIGNQFETKVVTRDTTGEVTERNLKLIDNLNLSSSYNFAADSLKLATLRTNLSSNAVPGFNFRVSADFDFYKRNENGIRVNQFLISDQGFKPFRLERFTANASTSFKGGSNGVQVYTPVYRRDYDPFDQSIFRAIDPYFNDEIIPPLDSPWRFSLNFSYSWTLRPNADPNKNAILNAQNITFRLTPKWNFSTQIGYDFIQKEITPSDFNLTRNLECWDLSFQIRPFGDFQYYFFSLTLNSAQIQSLFQKLPVLKNLERNSSPTGRRF